MSNKNFLSGMGMGIVAGSAIGMLVSPRTRRSHGAKKMVGRAIKNVGSVIEEVSDALK